MDDDSKLFSRALSGRPGDGAQAYALNRSTVLKACGDGEGARVWHAVAVAMCDLHGAKREDGPDARARPSVGPARAQP